MGAPDLVRLDLQVWAGESGRFVAQQDVAIRLIGVRPLRSLDDSNPTGEDGPGLVGQRALVEQIARRVWCDVVLHRVVIGVLLAVAPQNAEHLRARTDT